MNHSLIPLGINGKSIFSFILLFSLSFSQLYGAPQKVSGVVATSQNTSISLSWSTTTDISDGDKYEIEISSWSPSSFTFLAEILHPSNTHFVENLINGNTYFFRVRASTGTNPEEIGEWSDIASTYPWVNLGIPSWSIYTAAKSTSAINWAWTLASNASAYSIIDALTLNDISGPLPDYATYWIQTDLTPNTSSEVFIRATNGLLVSDSIPRKIYTLASIPQNFYSPLQPGTTIIYLAWSPNGNPPPTRYRIEISTDDGNHWNFIAELINSTTHHIDGLSEKTTYFFKIYALNSDNLSTNTIEISTRTGSINPQPPNLTIAEPWNLDGEVRLTFTAPYDDSPDEPVKSYVIKYATYTLNETNWSAPSSSIAPQNITPSAPGTGQTHTITGLYPGTTYYFGIKSIDEVGNFSSISSVLSAFAKDNPPNPPTNISAIPTSETNIKITWTLPSYSGTDDRSRYYIYRATFPFTLYTQATYYAWQIHPNTQYNDSSVENPLKRETTYYYRMATEDWGDGPAGSGLYSMPLGSTTLSSEMVVIRTPDLTPPPPITTLSALTGTLEGRINLSWTSPPDNGARPYEGAGENITNGSFRIRWTTNAGEQFSTSTYNVEIPTTTFPGATNFYLITGLTGGTTYYIRVFTCDGDGNWSAPSTGATTYAQVDVTAPSAITFISGNSNWRRLNLIWTAPGDDGTTGAINNGLFEIRLSTTGAISNETDWQNVPSGYPYRIIISTDGVNPLTLRYYTITGLTNSVTYYAAIKTSDDHGNYSVISSTSFRAVPLNNPPAAFTLYSPSNNSEIQTLTPQLYWNNSSDTDIQWGDSFTYRVYYSTSQNFELNITTISTTLMDTSYIVPSGHLSEDKRYYWRVIAIDSDGSVRMATEDFSFITNVFNSTPTAPVLQTPSNGTRVNQLSPQLTWQSSYDSDIMDVLRYKVDLATSPNFASYISSAGITNNYFTPSYFLTENLTYWWRVSVTDGKLWVQSDSTYYFKVNAIPEAPLPFSLISPSDNQRLTSLSATFAWESTRDPDPDENVSYNLIWSQFSTFSSSTTIPNLLSVSSTVILPDDNRYYYWKVEAIGTDGMKRTSNQTLNRFYIDIEKEKPLTFSLIEPAYGVIISTTLKPMFRWTEAIDPDPADIVRYHIEISQSPNFAGSQPIPTATDNYYQPIAPLLDQTTYYWRVRASGYQGSPAVMVDDGYTFSSTTGVFIISMVNYPPENFSPISPSNGATISTKKPSFKWQESLDYDVGATVNYSVVISSEENFGTIIYSTSGLTATETVCQKELFENKKYWWKVISTDNKGASTESSVYSFTIPILTIPQKVSGIKSYLTPAATSFILKWSSVRYNQDETPIDDLDGYNIYKSLELSSIGDGLPYLSVGKDVLSIEDPVGGKYYYIVRARDTSGVESENSIAVRVFSNDSAFIESPDKIFTLELPPEASKALNAENNKYGDDLIVTISSEPTENALKEFGLNVLLPNGKKLPKYTFAAPLKIKLSIDKIHQSIASSVTGKYIAPAPVFSTRDIALFWHNGVEYIRIPSLISNNNDEVVATLANTGTYQIRRALRTPDAEGISAINPPKTFTPGIEPFEKIQFFIDNPFAQEVSGIIMNLKGTKVADISTVGDNKETSVLLEWDGKNPSGEILPKGIYIYQIKIGNTIRNGTILLAK